MEKKHKISGRSNFHIHHHTKRDVIRPVKKTGQVYITSKSNFKAQLRECENLLNSGIRSIYLHSLGNAINRGINLALNLVNNSNGALSYAINTSTIELIDEYHPLYDDDELKFNRRNNSAVHIKVYRNAFFDVEPELE